MQCNNKKLIILLFFGVCFLPLYSIMRIAHRGCVSFGPENSQQAIESALCHNDIDALEIDIQMTKDKNLIVMHDSTIDRTTNGSGRVSEHTLKSQSSFIAQNGQGIPFLKDVFSHMDAKKSLLLDVKTTKATKQVIACIDSHKAKSGFAGLNIIVGSFFPSVLTRIHGAHPALETVLFVSERMSLPLCKAWIMSVKKIFGNAYTTTIGISKKYATSSLIQWLHARGKKVYVFNVDTVHDAYIWEKRGADGIIFDHV